MITSCPLPQNEAERLNTLVSLQPEFTPSDGQFSAGANNLDITKSHSRPHVSDDNPYSESQFKTMKYRPDFPARFGSLADARAHCQTFFTWYNTEHRHSGIGYMTPSSVHYGQALAARALRQDALDAAFLANPKRFKGRRPEPPALPTAAWINPPATEQTDDSNTPASTVNS